MSVRWDFPLVKFHNSQVSIVPKSKLLFFKFLFTSLTLSIIHLILVAEKYGSSSKPVIFWIFLSIPFLFKFSQRLAVLLSCQTIAL